MSLTEHAATPSTARLQWRQDVPLRVQTLALRASLALGAALDLALANASYSTAATLALAYVRATDVAPIVPQEAPVL